MLRTTGRPEPWTEPLGSWLKKWKTLYDEKAQFKGHWRAAFQKYRL